MKDELATLRSNVLAAERRFYAAVNRCIALYEEESHAKMNCETARQNLLDEQKRLAEWIQQEQDSK